jgi:hypothetical protein
MSLPITLPYGLIAVYGTGTATGSSVGFTLFDQQSDVRFGVVEQVYPGAVFVYNGDSIIFRDEDVSMRLRYSNYPYTFLPDSLVTKESPLP